MAIVRFGEYLPDVHSLNNPGLTVAKNLTPHSQGYHCWYEIVAYSDALTAYARGGIGASDKNGNQYVYAGDATKLYSLTDDTWTDVSKAATTYGSGARWEFAKWDQQIIATNYEDVPQVITMGGANFADLGGTPPQAKHIGIVRDFVVLGNTQDNGGGNPVPERVRWSGISDEASWAVSATTQADFNDLLGNAGPVQRIIGGEYGVILCEHSAYRMTYVGSPVIWQFDEVLPDIGCISGGGVARVGNLIFMLSHDGFWMIENGIKAQRIGADKVDRTVLSELDYGNVERITASVHSTEPLVLWALPVTGNSGGLPNKIYVYNYLFNRWAFIDEEVELLLEAATTGYTLEGLDTISTSVDALTESLDSPAYQGGATTLSAIKDGMLGFFTGDCKTAVVETGEWQLAEGQRSMLRGIRPIQDGGTATVQIAYKVDAQTDTISAYDPPVSAKTSGVCPVRRNARYFKLRVNSTGNFTDVIGFETESTPVGLR